jgi:transcriptional regulator with XRE-family HTH domain
MEMDEVQGGSPAKRPKRANELGATGQRVADNVRQLRSELSLTTEQLAVRVTELGRPMGAATITKIEKRQRRIDADDLVVLALALETRPDALLLPPTIDGEVKLTEGKTATALSAWQWANGRRPLDVPEGDDGTALVAFQMRAQPIGLRAYAVTTPAGMIAAASEKGQNTPPEKLRSLYEALGYPVPDELREG